MLLRELQTKNFIIFVADVRVRHRNYSQAIKVQISARNIQEARKQLEATYGKDATIIGLKKQ
jgi:hypothetical protein|tara:strand:+ start:327 stop:512 length:186 start_codon:yes stop_codon:yes gene_type:complete